MKAANMLGMDDTDYDKHAKQRDRKQARRKTDRLMRGNRSVFEIQKAIVKRAKRLNTGDKNGQR